MTDVTLDVKYDTATQPTGYQLTNKANFYYRYTDGNAGSDNGDVKYTVDTTPGSNKKFEIKFGNDTEKSRFDMEDFTFYECGTTDCSSLACGSIPSSCSESSLFTDDGSVSNKNKVKVKDDITEAGIGIYRVEVSYSYDGVDETGILCDPRWQNEV